MLRLRDFICLGKLPYTEPAYIALALTVQFFHNRMLTENIAASLPELFKEGIQTAGGRFLTQTVAEMNGSKHLRELTEDVLLKDKSHGYEILLTLLQ